MRAKGVQSADAAARALLRRGLRMLEKNKSEKGTISAVVLPRRS